MRSKTRFLVDDGISPVHPFDIRSQRLSVEWHDMTEKPPGNTLLYLCWNTVIQPDVLHVKTMESIILENCRATYEHISPNIIKAVFERLVDEDHDYWVTVPDPDYWAIKEFPRPPIGF